MYPSIFLSKNKVFYIPILFFFLATTFSGCSNSNSNNLSSEVQDAMMRENEKGFEKAFEKGAKEAVLEYINQNNWEDITSRKSKDMFALVLQNTDNPQAKLLIYHIEQNQDSFYLFNLYQGNHEKNISVFDSKYPLSDEDLEKYEKELEIYLNEFESLKEAFQRKKIDDMKGIDNINGARIDIYQEKLLMPNEKYILVRHRDSDLAYLMYAKKQNDIMTEVEFVSYVLAHFPNGFDR